MACITKRGAHQFLARVRRRGFPEQSRSFHTREQAEVWAAEVELSFRRGTFKDPGDWSAFTVRDALERYLTEVTPHKKGSRTEAQRIRWLQQQSFASRPMTRLQVQELRAWRDAQIAVGSAPGTVGLKLATLSHLYTVAVREWGIEGLDNPVKKLQKPRVRNARDRRIFADEESRLLAAADPIMASIIVFAIETGMRRSEILALKWADIQGRVARLHDTKNSRPRAVPLSQRALAALPPRGSGAVYPISAQTVSSRFRELCRKCGLQGARFHDLRHEATSRLFEKGLSLTEVMTITGHATTAMVHRYAHLMVDDLAAKLG